MKESTQQHIQNIYSKDRSLQGASFKELMKITEQPVDWAYQTWDDLLDLLKNGDNRQRSIAAQLLCNLAKSDPDGRMEKDLSNLFEVTKDERFVTARHSLLALWRVGIVNPSLTQKTVDGLSGRFKECIDEKNCTLIRYDICRVLRNIFDHTGEEQIFRKTMSLIEKETDDKYRKKYLSVWKDVIKKKAP
ncbi:MAG: hypothetical protein WEA56_04910 [Balneolaceae bacterium]